MNAKLTKAALGGTHEGHLEITRNRLFSRGFSRKRRAENLDEKVSLSSSARPEVVTEFELTQRLVA
jgi:hypothetical protein